MARRLKGPPPGDVRKFVPESYGNRDDADPVVVWIKQPTELERRRIDAGQEPVAFARDRDGKPRRDGNDNLVMTVDLRQIIDRQVDAISLFVTRVDGYELSSGEAIDDGASFAENGEPDFIAEVYLEIMEKMSLTDDEETGEKKALNEPSSSTPPATSPDTTATNASKTDSRPPATATTRKEIPTTSPSPPTD